MPESERHPTVRLVVAVFVSLLTSGTVALFTRSSLLQATRWGWLVFVFYLTWEAVQSNAGRRFGIKFRAMYGGIPAMSYILVPLCFAVLGLFYWWGINKAYSFAPTDAAPAQAQNEQAAKDAAPISPEDLLTLRKLFDADFDHVDNLLCAGGNNNIRFEDSPGSWQELPIEVLYCFDHAAMSKFAAFYIPATPKAYDLCVFLAGHYNEILPSIEVETKSLGQPPLSSRGYPFSGRIFLYYENYLSYEQLGALERLYAQRKLSPIFRGPDYLQAQILRRAYEKAKNAR